MPRLDGTGPQGAGPVTGRGMGYCGSDNCDRFYHPTSGFRDVYGFGYRGRRHGPRLRFYVTGIPGWVPPTPEQEIAELNAWAEQLRTQLDAIQKRIEDLKA